MAATDQPALSRATLEALRGVSTATLTMQLFKRGLRRVAIQGPLPLDPATPRLVGPAFTARFIPAREDISTRESYARAGSLREAIDSAPAGSVMVIEARGELGAGTLGDILVARLKARGVAGAVTDGAIRDTADVRKIGLPVFCAGVTAPPSITALHFADWDLPVGCGGVAVLPGDVIVGDGDGVIVVPRALADEIADEAPEQERFERFVQLKVQAGAEVVGLYPPSDETLADYQKWLEAGEPEI
jgi:regulator of RNase E activity RraA